MASVYILYSSSIDKFYIGSCLDLNERLEQHIQKAFPNSFTSITDDWQLFLAINELTYSQARSIEKHIKSMKSKRYVQNLQVYPEMIDKLKMKYL